MRESEVWTLLEEVETETARAKSEGYFPLDVGNSLEEARDFLNKYREARNWKGGYWGRAENYDLGFHPDRERSLLDARESLLRAKGALIALKLPKWAKELRYYYIDSIWGEERVESLDPRRGVVFMSGTEWALKGFPESQGGLWNRCNCRPTREGIDLIEKFHAEGKRAGTYMSGGMTAITYALLPDSEEDWTDDFMRWYAGAYWHGEKERFWGARGSSSEWNADIPAPKDFSKWMMRQLEFAQRIGFDFVHLDEAFGAYPDASKLSEKDPNFVMCPNNLARMYVDESGWRFGWTAMGESLGHPSDWDDFNKKMRQRSLMTRNIPWWGWHTYKPFEKGYHDLTLATSLANRGTDVAHSEPSDECVEFTRKFSDYVYGSYIDSYVPQDVIKARGTLPTLRTIVDRRVLSSDREELIVHLLNIKPETGSVDNIELEVNISAIRARAPPVITLIAPGAPPTVLKARATADKLEFKVPSIKTWGVVVIGESLFSRVELRMVSRDGIPVADPLDNAFVPGHEIQVAATAEELVPTQYSLELHLPEGWRCEEIGRDGLTRLFRVMPVFAEEGKAYAITPLVKKEGQISPSWPLVLQAAGEVDFRLIYPVLESPSAESDHDLEVKNRGKAKAVKFRLRLPDGWKADNSQFDMNLDAGEVKKVGITLMPPDLHLRFLDQLDVTIPLEWELEGLVGTATVVVRVFPKRFLVYAKGVEKMIMHSYPNFEFVASIDEAKSALKRGERVALWFANQDPEQCRSVVDEFVSMGGGVVWMGEPFEGVNCPVTPEGGKLESRLIKYIEFPGEPEDSLLHPARRKRAQFESETGFRCYGVKVKDWGRVLAVWLKQPESGSDRQSTLPAVVVSGDPGRRVVYVGSDLEATSENSYRFEERNHHESHWYQTYIFYNLLSWASSAFNL
jgi:hypothetical protein